MSRALAGVPAHSFSVPESGVTSVLIDTRNGCLADEFTPAEYRSYATLATGTAPTEVCREPGDVVKVPDVFSFPLKDAIRILESKGLAVEVEEKPTRTYPPGRVIGVAPGAGEKVPRGSTVTLTVSARKEESRTETVPEVLGRGRDEAESAIERAGFEVETVVARESDRKQADRNEGLVWKQSPAGGSEATEGSTVTIWVNPDD